MIFFTLLGVAWAALRNAAPTHSTFSLWEGINLTPHAVWHQRSLEMPFQLLDRFLIPPSFKPGQAMGLFFKSSIPEKVMIYDFAVPSGDLEGFMGVIKVKQASLLILEGHNFHPHTDLIWLSFHEHDAGTIKVKAVVQAKSKKGSHAFSDLMRSLHHGLIPAEVSNIAGKEGSFNPTMEAFPGGEPWQVAWPDYQQKYHPAIPLSEELFSRQGQPFFPTSLLPSLFLRSPGLPTEGPLDLTQFVTLEASTTQPVDSLTVFLEQLQRLTSAYYDQVMAVRLGENATGFDLILRDRQTDPLLMHRLCQYSDRRAITTGSLQGKEILIAQPDSFVLHLQPDGCLVRLRRVLDRLEVDELATIPRQYVAAQGKEKISPLLDPLSFVMWTSPHAIPYLLDAETKVAYVYRLYPTWEAAQEAFMKLLLIFGKKFLRTSSADFPRSLHLQPVEGGTQYRVAYTDYASQASSPEKLCKLLAGDDADLEFNLYSFISPSRLI